VPCGRVGVAPSPTARWCRTAPPGGAAGAVTHHFIRPPARRRGGEEPTAGAVGSCGARRATALGQAAELLEEEPEEPDPPEELVELDGLDDSVPLFAAAEDAGVDAGVLADDELRLSVR
jgi:hypothetical protein